MKPFRPWRIRLLSVMLAIALLAILLSWFHRQHQIKTLLAEREYRLARLAWISNMEQRGYAPSLKAAEEEKKLQTIWSRLNALGVDEVP